MPNYDYKCKQCSYEFEEFQRISDSSLVTCPKCKKDGLVRIIHAGAGLHFKGSGFYLTDYKKSKSTSSGDTKPEKESGIKKEEKKTEAKTETKVAETGSSKKD